MKMADEAVCKTYKTYETRVLKVLNVLKARTHEHPTKGTDNESHTSQSEQANVYHCPCRH